MNELTERENLMLFLGFFYYRKDNPYFHKLESVYEFIKINNVQLTVEQIDKTIQDSNEVVNAWLDDALAKRN